MGGDCTDHRPERLQQIADTLAAAETLAASLGNSPALGLDTEFLRERTYRAQLCLVQLAGGDEAACVDPLAIPDLAPLAPLLRGEAIKVMHASRQDLEVLHPAVGSVRPVFDTQIAAALAGFAAQIGYAELVRRLLGRELPKAHTRTDWSRRPLSEQQIEYALDDVRFLVPLKDALEERLERLGRLSWLAEELADLEAAGAPGTEPAEAWRRLKGLQGLDPGRLRLVRALAAWRERRASDRDRPRGWILEDAALREIVLRVPRSLEALAQIAEIPQGVIRNCGRELLECVAGAEIPDPPPPLEARPRPDPVRSALVRKLITLNQATAADLGLSPEVLATRRDLERLAEGYDDVPALRGWRREAIGMRLLAAR